MEAFCVIIVLALLGVGGWYAYRTYEKKNPPRPLNRPPADSVATFIPPAPRYDQHTLVLSLPSTDPSFQFSCAFLVRYRVDKSLPAGQAPNQIADAIVREAAPRISARFPLASAELLQRELNIRLREPGTTQARLLEVRAECSSITTDEGERRLLEEVASRKFELEVESRLMEAYLSRAAQLAAIFAEPNTAALWWYVQHPAEIDKLPDKIKLMSAIDRRLKDGAVDGAGSAGPALQLHHRAGADLERFLAGADVSSKAAVGTVLGGMYERLGRTDLAERARALAEARAEEPAEDGVTTGPAS